jgi:hypothetical protein
MLKPKYIPVHVPTTGVRRCWGCNTLYAAAAAMPNPVICPACHSHHTVVVNPSESAPTQTAFFKLPPVSRPSAWCLEWRWRPCDKVKRRGYRPPDGYHPEPPNDWQRYSTYNINDKKP